MSANDTDPVPPDGGDTGPILPGPGDSDYERYLRTDELLSLQRPPEERVHRDELLFQTVHQSSELWLKLALQELEEATRLIDASEPLVAVRLMRRAVLCLRQVTDALDMLDLLDPWDYNTVRTALGHGSGFDSPGFRALARATPPLGAAFDRAVERLGVPVTEIYRRRSEFEEIHALAEALTDYDERLRLWRFRHYSVVARAIGEESMGIAGTPVQVLGRLIAQRQLPKLWELRSRLVEIFEAERSARGGDEDRARAIGHGDS
ncbi:MAG TPA: tryptophan 2,3-dioxygenase family protein [Solirubrobacteraceae bacterium]|jgi:tryptophan 2,3-dioxygenase|nr:tryptophan 2,3-dioxygenase family protein [Solirubrobacteraceae bacterium]